MLMPSPPRPRRVAVPGARVHLANTFTDLVNVSRTGVVIRVGYELRLASEWPLMLELSGHAVRVTGRVVRCEPVDSLPSGAMLTTDYALALTFVNASPEAQTALDELCGTARETNERVR
jgi:hypothetical protein